MLGSLQRVMPLRGLHSSGYKLVSVYHFHRLWFSRMAQKRIRIYLFHSFDALLSYATAPFAKAETITKYATNGYYLLGITLIVASLPFWLIGILTRSSIRIPVWLREDLRLILNSIGLKGLSEIAPLVLLPVLLYTIIYFIKPVRLFVGEKFADAFFRVVEAGIKGCEWCAEHRWWSLIVIIVLLGFITWGIYYISEAAKAATNSSTATLHALNLLSSMRGAASNLVI
jgi:hypothetical protein